MGTWAREDWISITDLSVKLSGESKYELGHSPSLFFSDIAREDYSGFVMDNIFQGLFQTALLRDYRHSKNVDAYNLPLKCCAQNVVK